MIGALIGAGLSVASSIAQGISSRKAKEAQEALLKKRKAENQAWYDRKYNEDPTKRADTVRLLTQMQEQIRDRNRAAKGRQAVMGGTEDSVTAVREANSKALADTTSQIIAANDSRKDAIEQQYQRNKQNIENSQMQMAAEQAGNTAGAASGIAGTAANIAGILDSTGKKDSSGNNKA